jgi:hypothetical protein
MGLGRVKTPRRPQWLERSSSSMTELELETDDKVVGVPHNDDIALGLPPSTLSCRGAIGRALPYAAIRTLAKREPLHHSGSPSP